MTVRSAEPHPPMRQIVSSVLGPLAIDPAHVVRFAQGLLGFPEHREWVVLMGDRPHLAWLQSIDEPALALLLLDPFEVFDEYAVDLPAHALRAVAADALVPVAVFAAVTIGSEAADDATANLRGLILINWQSRRGMQCVIDDARWSVRERVPAGTLE